MHETLCHALGTMQRIENFRPCPDGPMSMHLIRWVSLYPGAAGLCTPRHNDFREGQLTPGAIAGELARRQRRLVHPIRHDPPRTRRSARRHVSPLDGGLEVHQESSAVAYAPEERAAEVVFLGTIGTRPCDLDTRVRPLTSQATPLVFVDAAGPCGDWLSRDLPKPPLRGWVVAPARVPKPAGDRVNTARRDAPQLARLLRSGDLTPVDVPAVADEAIRAPRACGGHPGSLGRHEPVEGLPAAPGDPG